MPKLDNSIVEENVRVTRSSRRAGSVDLDFEQSSQHTPLKSNILETISETDSIDSRLTPRRGTRRSIISLDLNTPQKKFNLTKENLARLDNFNEGAGTPPSASKRTTRRTSITSEDVPGVAKTSATLPFVKLARTKVPIISEDGKENTKRARGRPPKLIKNIDTIKTQNNNKLNSPYNTRRSVSSSPSVSFEELKVDETQNTHTPIKKSPQKIVETSNTLNISKLDKTPIGNLLARTVKNQTSTPNIPSSTVESEESIDNATIEIEESSSDNEINDSHEYEESLVEYYRNSSLKKFTGTVQNKVTEGESPKTEAKPVDGNLLNNENNSYDKMADNESCSSENIPLNRISRTKNKSKLSLNNTSSIETQNIERDGLNNSSKISDTGTLVNQNDNADINYEIINKSQSTTMDNKNENDDKVTQVTNKDSSDNHITLETPTKQSVNTPGSSKKGTPSPVILTGSENEVILEKLDISSKTSFLTKLATPGKQDSPLKQGTPMKQATPAKQGTPMKQATPAKQETSMKQATPAKPTTPLEENLKTPKSTPTKPATPLVEKMRIPKARESLTKINKSIDSASIAESPAKSRNSSQAIEINGNTSKVLFNQDDDVSVKQLVNENCKLNNSVNIVNESVSILSSSDDSENTNGSSDPTSMIDTFENFTDNLFRTKAKSCSPKVPKKSLLQSQAISSSFHGAVKTDKEIDCDELTKSCDKVSNQSKSASGIFVIEDDNLSNESEINVQDTIKTSKFENRLTYVVRADSHKPDMASFIEEDNNEIVSDIADVVSDVKISSSKKPKRRQSLYVENEMSMKSFVDEENHEEIGINVSTTERNSTKKQKRHSSSIVDSIIPLDTTVGESFVKADNQEADDVSEELKTTGFVTQRKNKMECKLLVYESDCDNQTAGPSNTSAGLFVETDNDLNISSLNDDDDTSATKRENKLDSNSLVYGTENDDQQATLSNTSAGAFVETDNDLNISSLNETNKKLNRSKTKKMKSPKVVAEKRKISLEEIEETCNKILQERELARKKLREQFAKKKGKKKTKIINDTNEEVDDSLNKSLDRTPKSLGKIKETEILSPKLKQQLEHETKQRSANSSQIKMDLSVSSHYSDSSQTKKTKKQSQKASPTATTEPIQVSSPKSKKIKTPPSNHKLSDNEEENKISQSTEVVQMRAEKRKHKHPTLVEQNTSELHSPKGKKLKKQKSQKLTPIIAEQPVPLSPTKTKKIKIPKIQLNDSIAPEQSISSRRLPDSILNQLDEKQTILESSQAGVIRGKKRKLKLPTFIEKELTPEIRPSGFKVSPITPKILPNNFRVSPITPKFSNNFRVSVMPKTKLPKKKLSFNEPTNVLPKPVWTTAGVFEESDMGQENRKNIAHSTTNFIVEDIGDNLNRAYSKVDKHRKAELMEFKNKSLFRANVPRADAKHVLKSLRFEKGNIKFISK